MPEKFFMKLKLCSKMDFLINEAWGQQCCVAVKSPRMTPALLGVQAAPRAIQLSANGLGKTAKDGPSIWTPTSHTGYRE